MSRARPVYPGAVLLCSRRVHKQQRLLRPSRRLNRAIEYIMAVTSKRYGILLHSLCAMSSDILSVRSDPLARVVEFERDTNALIARVVNSMHGDRESLWSREQSTRVACDEPADALETIIETMATPVEAGWVAHGRNWPGVRCVWPMRKTVRRPAWFRDEDSGGAWPAEVTLEFHRPPGFDHLSDDELATLIRDRLEQREAQLRERARNAARGFLGRRAVLAQSRYSYPTSGERTSRIRPTVAAQFQPAQLERLRAGREWLARYEAQMERVRAGEQDVIFPFGTWKMRVYYRFACEPPPTHERLAA